MMLLDLPPVLSDLSEIRIKSSFSLKVDHAEIYLHQLKQFLKSSKILIDISRRRPILRIGINVISVSREHS